jgi:hypothetical protein
MIADDQTNQAMLEEYTSLRDEIKYSSRIRFTVLTASTSAWAGLVVWVVANRSYFYAEIALIVLHVPVIIGYLLTILSNRHIMRVSTYIREFIEPEIPGLRWETLVAQYQKKSKIPLSITLIAAVSLILMSFGAFGLERVLAIPVLYKQIPYLDLIILSAFWSFMAAFHLPVILKEGSRGYENAAYLTWQRIKDTRARPRNKEHKRSRRIPNTTKTG